MKLLLHFMIVFSLIIPSPSLFAKNSRAKRLRKTTAVQSPYHRLSDYVLNIEQIRALSYPDRVAYFYFMARSMEMIDFSLKRHYKLNAHLPQVQKEIKELQAKFDLLQSIEDLVLPKANAFLPLVYLGIVGIASGVGIEALTNPNAEMEDYVAAGAVGALTAPPFLKAIKPLSKAFGKAKSWFSKAPEVTPPKASVKAPKTETASSVAKPKNTGLIVTSGVVLGSGVAADAVNNGKERPDTKETQEPSNKTNETLNTSAPAFPPAVSYGSGSLSLNAIGQQVARDALGLPQVPDRDQTQDKASTKESKAKLKSGTCVIANYVSEYEEVADANLCKQGVVKTCKDGRIKCGSFGLQLKNEICESKKPINSLTQRCAESLGKTLINEGIGYIDSKKYKEWEDGVRSALKDFENSRVGNTNQTFNEYCSALKDEDTAKDFPQAVECKAIKTTINTLINSFPSIARHVIEKEKKAEAIAKQKARIKAEKDFLAQKSSCQDPRVKSDADIASLERCTACGLKEQLGQETSPSPTYLEMLRILAVQCGGKKGKSLEDTAKDKSLVRHRMAQMISSIGFCQNFPTKNRSAQMSLLKNHYSDLIAGKASIDDEEISKLFEKAYGIDSEDAQKAFCGKGLPASEFEWGDAYKMQNTFNRRMYKNRTDKNNSTRSNRERSGWAECDTEIQLSQNRPIIDGTPAKLARQYTKYFNEEDGNTANYYTKDIHRNQVKPRSGIVSWNPAYSGIEKNGKSRLAEDLFSLIDYPTERKKKKYKVSEISEFINGTNAKPIAKNIQASNSLKEELVYACGGNRPKSHLRNSNKSRSSVR